MDAAIRYAGIGDEAGGGLERQLAGLARLGWSSIELRTVDGVPVAGLDESAFARLVDRLRARSVATVCVASGIGNWARPITGDFDHDLRELDVLAGRCATLGTPYVRVMSYVNDGLTDAEWGRAAVRRMRKLARRAEQAGLVLVHENCTGWAGSRAERMLRLVDEVGDGAFRLLFDSGNGIAYGYDAYEVLAQVAGHVAHVHVKDAVACGPGVVYTLPGAGHAAVAACLRLLLESGYTGSWSIEPHFALRPHEPAPRPAGDHGARGERARGDGFVAAGTAFEQLVREQVLPGSDGWQAVPGGLVRSGDR